MLVFHQVAEYFTVMNAMSNPPIIIYSEGKARLLVFKTKLRLSLDGGNFEEE